MSMKFSEIIAAIGDERILIQPLASSLEGQQKSRKDGFTQFSFITNAVDLDMATKSGQAMVGAVVFIPLQAWKDVTTKLPAEAHAKAKLTAEQMFKKFGPAMLWNENCLQDIACPKCGHREKFKIDILTEAELTDDGTDANEGDHNWEGDSNIQCSECDHVGKVDDFTFEGLDDLIAEKNPDQEE